MYEASVRRRVRLEAAVRGWIRENSSPRSSVFIFLCGGATVALAFTKAAHDAGVAVELCAFYSAILTWIVFALLLRWRAGAEAKRIDIREKGIEHFILQDELGEMAENRPCSGKRREFIDRSVQELCRGFNQSGANSPLLFMVLGSATLGVWVIWQLVRAAPALLSSVALDAVILPESPRLAEKVPTESWRGNLIAMTALHFICLAFVAAVLTFSLPYLILAIEQGHRR